jgi:hypothetical protein
VRRTFSGATLRPVNAKDTADSFARILEGYGTLCASVRVRCTCPVFVDTKISPNDTVREGGVHGRNATTVHARV